MRLKSFGMTMLAFLGCFSVSMSRAAAQTAIPIRELSATDAKSADHFGTILGIRELSDGSVLVNDGRTRHVILLDSRLAIRSVVLDSVAGSGRTYGPRASPLIPYLGDSTIFVDGASRALLILGPTGAVARVASAPKPNDLSGLAYATSGVDANGNLVYVGRELKDPKEPYGGFRSDSAPIVRANFELRTVDTLARIKLPGGVKQTDTTINGRLTITRVVNPLKTLDEWAVLSNGTIALVRGGTYHVDFLQSDGKQLSGPKLPFDWKRLSDADKQALLDSARAVREADERDTNAAPTYASAAALASAATGGPPVTRANSPRMIQVEAPITEIADYWPPIRPEAAKADRDANLWILPTTTAQSRNGELVYDVVNGKGELFERVRVPAGKAIAGFGKNGVVYLMYREGAAGWVLERARVERPTKS